MREISVEANTFDFAIQAAREQLQHDAETSDHWYYAYKLRLVHVEVPGNGSNRHGIEWTFEVEPR